MSAFDLTGATPRPAFIEIDAVSKGFGEGARRHEVLAGVDMRIKEGELVAIVGFSGSGKSTLISLLAGLLSPDRGTIRVAGKAVTGPGTDRGVVFQNYSLLPWLDVFGNVELAVKRRVAGKSKAEARDYVQHYVELVGLGDAADKHPMELSGGMRQRVALARALALDPEVLLLDEPLGALDALTRAKMQDELVRIWAAARKTVVMVTNDVDEALILADRIVPLERGPAASMGPSFRVALERPRIRAELNSNAEFRRLRNEVSGYLAGLARGGGSTIEPENAELPDLEPVLSRFAERAAG